MKSIFYLLFAFGIILFSCGKDENGPVDFNDLSNLPTDTGGMHTSHVLGSTETEYGYYLYTPSGYQNNGPEFPLLVFLHGSGEKGDSKNNPDDLKKVLRNGPPKMIEKKAWAPTYPMIVASPQSPGNWDKNKIHEFITYLIGKYQVNEKRIYVTGLSMGGYGTFSYASLGRESYAAAVVPICGGGWTGMAEKISELPLWAFHGLADSTVHASQSINMVNKINEFDPVVKPKLTLYPGVGHNSWTMTYEGTGMGKESSDSDPFDMTIYDWMFQYEREVLEEVGTE